MGAVTPDVSVQLGKFFSVQGDIARLEEEIKAKKKELEQTNADLIELMEGCGLSQLRDTAGRTVYLKSPSVYASIKKDRKDEALEYVKTKWNSAEFVQATIPAQTLSRIVKEKLESGETIPDEFFSYYIKKKLGYRH